MSPITVQQQSLVRLFVNEVLAANTQKVFQIGVADHLFLYSSTGNLGDLKFLFDQASEESLIAGQIVATQVNADGTHLKFRELIIRNVSNTSITYTIVVSNGAIDFKGLVVSGNISVLNAQSSTGAEANDVVTGAAAKIVTGVSNFGVILQADRTNTDYVYIGFTNTVSATKKVFSLEPGQIYFFDRWKGDIYAFSAAAQKISITPLT